MKSIEDIASEIEEFVQQSSILEIICKYLIIPLSASPLVNFRDALSHYIKRYEAKTDEEKLRQESSIDEHLFRGIKDICVHIINFMKNKISSILNDSENRTQEHDYRKLLHKYKNLEIEIRKNSETTINRDLNLIIESYVI